MSKMRPVPIGDTFKQGNESVQPGEDMPIFLPSMLERDDIVLIMTVESNGMVTVYNHPKVSERLKSIDDKHPYPTGKLYDTCVLTMAIYADENDPQVLRLGAWNPGPPRRCST